jgi:FO synthase
MPPQSMDDLIASCGRIPVQRTTLYHSAPLEQRTLSYAAQPLEPLVQTPPRKRAHAAKPAVPTLLSALR